MNKEKSDEIKVDIVWLRYFEKLKQNQPDILISFFNVLTDFVRKFPHDARYLTVESLHGILLEET
ncbi:MAG: hypothetical protein ACETWQ_22535 [Phycisphaerae bacterium]